MATQKSLDQYTGARRQPVIMAITTAGYDRNSICWELHDYALKVRDGILDDPTFLPIIYAADPDDDWEDPKVWAKANPGLGVSIKMDYLKEECRRAKESPAYQNTFRRLHLNQWTEQAVRWMEMSAWDACDGFVDEEELHGEDCYVGIDLSSTQDITAAVLVFPRPDGSVAVLPRFWIPEAGLRKRVKRDRVPYDTWLQDEFVFATDGNVVDYEAIRYQLHEDGDRFRIREIAIDRWNATQITTQLIDDGFTVVPFGQGFKSMSGPTKELEKLVLEGKLHHGGNPVLRWMASNVAVKQDPAGNLKPDKQKSSQRIDGVVALVMGLGRAIVQPEGLASVYETRGILTL